MIDSLKLAQQALGYNLASWPSVTYQERIKCLPKTSGFYCIWRNGQPIYIGEAQNIHGRWYGGHKHRRIAASAELKFYEYNGERLERQFVEWMLIIIHQPMLNSFRNIRHRWYDTLIEAGWQPVSLYPKTS